SKWTRRGGRPPRWSFTPLPSTIAIMNCCRKLEAALTGDSAWFLHLSFDANKERQEGMAPDICRVCFGRQPYGDGQGSGGHIRAGIASIRKCSIDRSKERKAPAGIGMETEVS